MPEFTPEELQTAIKVLSYSKIVKKWVEGEAKAFGVSLTTPEGKAFVKKQRTAAAERLIK